MLVTSPGSTPLVGREVTSNVGYLCLKSLKRSATERLPGTVNACVFTKLRSLARAAVTLADDAMRLGRLFVEDDMSDSRGHVLVRPGLLPAASSVGWAGKGIENLMEGDAFLVLLTGDLGHVDEPRRKLPMDAPFALGSLEVLLPRAQAEQVIQIIATGVLRAVAQLRRARGDAQQEATNTG